MHTKRVIPCLDIKDGRVVKGINFVNLRDAGDPADVAAYEAQKKYKSFRSYLWALESEAYTPGE